MATPPVWLTVEDVAAWLDEPGDPLLNDNLATATAAVKAAVERRRDDLFDTSDPPVFVPGEDVRSGAIIWAGIVYQLRSSPSGPAGFGDESMIFDALGGRRAEIMRLLGWRRPTTA